ncbi:MAG TPA: ABC transporter substrate-binding protein [Candidatus Ozemobacteraceae bacterium]|nr:ABC transporter substrate-binding protein [Candidatus Ozemobacteraceae bacterium]HQG27649.1 ABC transporter substrate-binding protein [Candidatus Ozemobacteraceae bacterium]
MAAKRIIYLTLLAILAWSPCPALAVEGSPWIVGILGALTGPKAIYGKPHLQGASLAAAEVNAAGGIDGTPLEIVAVDDGGEMGRVGDLMTRLIYDRNAVAVVGSVDSGCTHVAAMLAVKAHVPHLTCVATDPSLTRAGSPWTFRTLADDDRQAAALVEWLWGRGLRRISLLAGESRYGRMGARIFARRFREKGGEVTGPVFMAATETSASNAVRDADTGRAQAAVLWMLAPEGRLAAAALRRSGFAGIVAGGDGLASPAFYGSGDRAVDGVVVTCPYVAGAETPENTAFRRAYEAAYGEPADSFAAHAYDTVKLLASAASAIAAADRREPATAREALRNILANISLFRGVTGDIAFDASGNDVRDVRLAVCRGGALEPMRAGER